jgi:hypothetical protein
MCRLAALSDRLHAAAMAEWIVVSRHGTRGVEHPAFDAPISIYREAI